MRFLMLALLTCMIGCEDSDADAVVCNEEPFPWERTSPFNDPGARRLSLEQFCGGICPSSLQDFEKDLVDCEAVGSEGAAAHIDDDAGFYEDQWLRSEGCGSVQFKTLQGWEYYYNFDLASGALLGGAHYASDVGSGDGCVVGRIAGEVRLECDDEELSVCSRKEESDNVRDR